MIEWALLASGLVGAVTPYLVKGAETLTTEAAKEGWAQRGKIWEKVKGMFAPDDKMLHIYESYPETEKIQQDFANQVEEKLKAVPEATVNELQEMLKALPQVTKTNTLNQTGDGNIAVQDVSGSSINIGGKS